MQSAAFDVMTSNPTTIPQDSTLQNAIDLILKTGVSGLPVVDKDQHLVGIISEFALLAIAYDQNVLEDEVAEHMTRHVLTVEASDPLRKVADLFILHRIRRLPVLSDDKIVGIISRRDILRTARSAGCALSSISPFSTRAEAQDVAL